MYFITMFENLNDEGIDGQKICIGWKKTFVEANKTVSRNWGNIYADKFNYAIIEYIPDGIYKIAKRLRRSFYEFDPNDKVYNLIEEPHQLSNKLNFAMGENIEYENENDSSIELYNDTNRFEEEIFGKKVLVRMTLSDGTKIEEEFPASIAVMLRDHSDIGTAIKSLSIEWKDENARKWDTSI